jgi:hypothetical protein
LRFHRAPEETARGIQGAVGDAYPPFRCARLYAVGRGQVEVIHRRGPWKTKQAVELATLEWVSWFNHHRLMEPLGYLPPAEFEEHYHRQRAGQAATVSLNRTGLRDSPGRFKPTLVIEHLRISVKHCRSWLAASRLA